MLFLANGITNLLQLSSEIDLDNPSAKIIIEMLSNIYSEFIKEDPIKQERIKKIVESFPKKITIKL
ncbi:MAG: hypothetical protein ACO2OX_03465 [Candidatus Nanopusillus sp.]|jgi:hypothetical protein